MTVMERLARSVVVPVVVLEKVEDAIPLANAMAAAIAVLDKVPSTVFNAIVAILFAPMLANAIRAGLKNFKSIKKRPAFAGLFFHFM